MSDNVVSIRTDFDHRQVASEHLQDARRHLLAAAREMEGRYPLAHHFAICAVADVDDAQGVITGAEEFANELAELSERIERAQQ